VGVELIKMAYGCERTSVYINKVVSCYFPGKNFN